MGREQGGEGRRNRQLLPPPGGEGGGPPPVLEYKMRGDGSGDEIVQPFLLAGRGVYVWIFYFPAAAKGISVHLRRCSQKSGVALAQLLPSRVSPPGSGGGAEGCPGGVCGRSAVPSRPVPQGELSWARENSQRFTGEQRSRSGGSIHSPGAHLRRSGLVSAARNQRSSLGLCG